MYNYMIAHPSMALHNPPVTGDFLAVAGVINPAANTAGISFIRRMSDAVNVPVLTPGDYSIRLLDGANPPSISNVALQGAPNPVRGVVTLGWSASDPDGDALSFEVAYSRDNGTTFQPVATNLSGNSAQIDTAQLGGSGTAILRVTASDGVNSAYADSAPFVMWGQFMNCPHFLTYQSKTCSPDRGANTPEKR